MRLHYLLGTMVEIEQLAVGSFGDLGGAVMLLVGRRGLVGLLMRSGSSQPIADRRAVIIRVFGHPSRAEHFRIFLVDNLRIPLF